MVQHDHNRVDWAIKPKIEKHLKGVCKYQELAFAKERDEKCMMFGNVTVISHSSNSGIFFYFSLRDITLENTYTY